MLINTCAKGVTEMRKLTKKVIPCLLYSLVLFSIFSCATTYGQEAADYQNEGINTEYQIDSVEYVIENVHASFWRAPKKNLDEMETAYIDFYVNFEGDITAEDIFCITIYDCNGGSWKHEDPIEIKENFRETTSENYYKFSNCWDSKCSKYGSCLLIGEYVAEVQLINGEVLEHPFEVSAPGMLDSNNFTHLYNEDFEFAFNPSPRFGPMLKRANVSSFVYDKSNKQMIVNFAINDSRVYTGEIDFYDFNKSYVGSLKSDLIEDKTVTSVLNEGEVFYNNGKVNVVIFDKDDINFASGKSLDDIENVVIYLKDGFQFDGDDYHAASYSKIARISREGGYLTSAENL